MTAAFIQRVLNIQRSGYRAVRLLHGWYHVKMLPSQRMVGVHRTNMHQFTMSLYSKPHRRGVHVRLAVTFYLYFWQNDQDLLRSAAVTEVERIPK